MARSAHAYRPSSAIVRVRIPVRARRLPTRSPMLNGSHSDRLLDALILKQGCRRPLRVEQRSGRVHRQGLITQRSAAPSFHCSNSVFPGRTLGSARPCIRTDQQLRRFYERNSDSSGGCSFVVSGCPRGTEGFRRGSRISFGNGR